MMFFQHLEVPSHIYDSGDGVPLLSLTFWKKILLLRPSTFDSFFKNEKTADFDTVHVSTAIVEAAPHHHQKSILKRHTGRKVKSNLP